MPAGLENHTGKFLLFDALKGVTGRVKDLRVARQATSAAVENIRLNGAHFRRAIAARALT